MDPSRSSNGGGGCSLLTPTVIGRLYQLFSISIDFANAKHLATVTVVAVVEDCNIDVDDVALLEHRLCVGDPVAHNLFQGIPQSMGAELSLLGGVCGCARAISDARYTRGWGLGRKGITSLIEVHTLLGNPQ